MTVQQHLTPLLRSRHPVLVPDAHAIGMIGVIRSLGRAGYPVHACASSPDALGLQSRYATAGVCCPAYSDPGFLDWLAAYVVKHRIESIVPSEGFLLAVRPCFELYAPLMPIPDDADKVYRCLSKSAVLESLLSTPETAAHLPPTLIWTPDQPLPDLDALAALGTPLFVKGDGADDTLATDNIVVRELSSESARERIRSLGQRYRRVLVQGFVPGQGTGAYFLVNKGEIVQEFMNRCLHEVPHTGGFCSLRESWWHQTMMEDARIKSRHIGWEGVAMFEYRWDPDTDRFWFIELNARFWAALHLALYAGVDFPTMLLDLAHGGAVTPVADLNFGLQCRHTVPSEIGYVTSRVKDSQLPVSAKLQSVAGWFWRFLDPTIKSDLYFPRDSALYGVQWMAFLKQLRK